MSFSQIILSPSPVISVGYVGYAMFKPEKVLNGFFLTILTLVVTLGLAWRYLGSYMAAVFERSRAFPRLRRTPDLPDARHEPRQEQTWKRYAGAMIIFSAVSIAFTYVILRIQARCPLIHSTLAPSDRR